MDAVGSQGGDREVPAPDSSAPALPASNGRLTGLEAARAHATLVAGLTLCTVAFWFELRRALGGNGLSWAYVFEWPLFAVFAVYMWWNVLHGGRAVRTRTRPQKAKPALDPKYNGMLEAWEAHQRELRASVAAAEGGAGAGGTHERDMGAPAGD